MEGGLEEARRKLPALVPLAGKLSLWSNFSCYTYPIWKNLWFWFGVFCGFFVLFCFPDTLPFPTQVMSAWCLAGPQTLETMPGLWPGVQLGVEKALNTQLSASFPIAPPWPSTMGEGEAADSVSPGRVGSLAAPWQCRGGKTSVAQV